jgi:hypothetical protein
MLKDDEDYVALRMKQEQMKARLVAIRRRQRWGYLGMFLCFVVITQVIKALQYVH